MPLVTFGHGTLEQEAIVALLHEGGIAAVVDIRRYPGSRRQPHVASDTMADWLSAAGIGYRWEPRLGGRRRTTATTPHIALRNEGFRGYADYMETEEFGDGLRELLVSDIAGRQDDGGREGAVAVMCSESVWWRCHRRLLADTVTLLEELPISHLMHDGRLTPHIPTAAARREGPRLIYDVTTGGTPDQTATIQSRTKERHDDLPAAVDTNLVDRRVPRD